MGSSGGGSGSAIVPAIKMRLQAETDKIICVVTCTPDDNASMKEYMNCYEFFQELETIEDGGATFIIDNNKNKEKLVLNEQFACYLDAFLNCETTSTRGVVDRSEIENVLSQKGICIVNKHGSDKATTQTVIERIRDNIYVPLENDGVVANIALVNSNNNVRLNEIIESVGKPLATFEGWESDATVLAISGCSLPYRKLEEIKQKIEDNNPKAKHKIECLTPHMLRHTGCTRNAENGMDLKVLQYLMGHKSSKITYDVYNHVTQERVIQEVLKTAKNQLKQA